MVLFVARVERGSQFSGLLLGLSVCSYHVRELLVCWLFFTLLFVCLALVLLGGVFAVYASEQFGHARGSGNDVSPRARCSQSSLEKYPERNKDQLVQRVSGRGARI